MKKEELVVIGNGMAGAAVMDEITKLNPERYNITVFGKERHANYNRILLSSVLTGEKTLEDITLNPVAWYKDRGIRLYRACAVKGINRARRRVIAEDGYETPYHRLIIATGSVPFIPPIPGVEKAGVFSFRDVEDCTKIREASKGAKKSVVIGGGLLGLEVAMALKKLGLEVSVVHIFDALMERQLDAVAARYLKEDLEKRGIRVVLGKETVGVEGADAVTGLRFEDGDSIEADIAVISAGIRPNVELARRSGIYCEKGIVTSDAMQTFDPSVWAVGECVQWRGATFGLVAQIFEMSRVAANHLAGDARLVFKNRPVSMKLKIPSIELYSAGTVSDGCADTAEYHDRGRRAYKRLFFRDNRIEGILMYGDILDAHRLFQHLADASDVSERRKNIFDAASPSTRHADNVSAMPDSAIVCGCNGVTKRAIVEVIEKKGLFTREDVARETKASSSCGGCSAVVEELLESVLGSSFKRLEQKNICPCTKYSRDDVVRNIREKKLKSVGAVMEALGWETVGCEKCRPAINYYAAMAWPEDAEDDPSSRVVNERAHANIQKDSTFSVVPRMHGGVTTAMELKKIADAALKYNVPLIKLTGGQRIDLLGVNKEDLPSIWKDIGMPSGYAYGKALRTVKTCVGSRFCRYGTQDSLGLGVDMEKRLQGLWTPAKLKIGVSGCPRNCAESAIKDVGITGVAGGWEIYAGGSGGINLKAAALVATEESIPAVFEITGAFIQLYREEAEYGERVYGWMERAGLENIKAVVLNDMTQRKNLLERLDRALKAAAKDPWEELWMRA